MFSKSGMKQSTGSYSVERLREALDTADAVLIGAGAGLSTSAGLTYSGERFERYFSDFYRKYGISDMYSGGFYPYDTLEEYWEPSDGSYSDDIRAKFPADAADEALNDQAYIDDLKAACDQKALEARSAAAN